MVIELSGVQFGLKSWVWFQNQTSAHDTKLNYHFITAILKSQNSVATNML